MNFGSFRYDVLAHLPHKYLMTSQMWLGAESNRRHVDFQSTALPTELPSRDGADRVAPWGVHYAATPL
jgi:hypothetical protein